jgi:hypothetical protein
VQVEIARLQERRIINYRRGLLQILDMDALHAEEQG